MQFLLSHYLYVCVGCVISCVFLLGSWEHGFLFLADICEFITKQLYRSTCFKWRVGSSTKVHKVVLLTQLLSHHLAAVPC